MAKHKRERDEDKPELLIRDEDAAGKQHGDQPRVVEPDPRQTVATGGETPAVKTAGDPGKAGATADSDKPKNEDDAARWAEHGLPQPREELPEDDPRRGTAPQPAYDDENDPEVQRSRKAFNPLPDANALREGAEVKRAQEFLNTGDVSRGLAGESVARKLEHHFDELAKREQREVEDIRREIEEAGKKRAAYVLENQPAGPAGGQDEAQLVVSKEVGEGEDPQAVDPHKDPEGAARATNRPGGPDEPTIYDTMPGGSSENAPPPDVPTIGHRPDTGIDYDAPGRFRAASIDAAKGKPKQADRGHEERLRHNDVIETIIKAGIEHMRKAGRGDDYAFLRHCMMHATTRLPLLWNRLSGRDQERQKRREKAAERDAA